MNTLRYFIQLSLSWIYSRGLYLWWIIKYRGKKNIPPEVVFSQIEKNMKLMAENIEKAFEVGRDEMTREDMVQFMELREKIRKLHEGITDVYHESKK